MTRLVESLQQMAIVAADLGSTPGKSRKALFQEAAQWLEALEDAGGSERADIVDWLCESSQHRKAFELIREIDPALREIGVERLLSVTRQATEFSAEGTESSRLKSWAKWDDLKKHPLAVVVSVVILTTGISWKVFKEVEIKPLLQQIEQLKSQLSEHASITNNGDQQSLAKSIPSQPQKPDKLTGKRIDDPRSSPR
jgi:hypothetical protein